MTRRTGKPTRRQLMVLGGSTLISLAARPLWANLSANEISDYFNGLKHAKAQFSQFNSDGSKSSGMFYIRRPGRMRFEYDGPRGSVLIAGNSKIAVIEDPSRNSAVKIYPLSQTPLWLLLKRDVDLTSKKYSLGLKNTENATILTVHDPDKPKYGQMQLVFTPDPVTLRQWVVTSPRGERTTVILGPLDTKTRLNNSLFDIPGLDDREDRD
ncbi:MAG: outer membrane lipoprotein carrier protein LolA [Pseudomonadota bacterium]